MGKKKSIGLPGGPNEFLQDITQYISVEGYKSYSPDKNNPVNIIESGSITMQDVDFPVYGVDNLGNEQMMLPENDYQFPGDIVMEMPMLAKNGRELPTAQNGIGDYFQDFMTSLNPYNYAEEGNYFFNQKIPTYYGDDKDEAFTKAYDELGAGKMFLHDGIRYKTDHAGKTEDADTNVFLATMKKANEDGVFDDYPPGVYDRLIESWTELGQPNISKGRDKHEKLSTFMPHSWDKLGFKYADHVNPLTDRMFIKEYKTGDPKRWVDAVINELGHVKQQREMGRASYVSRYITELMGAGFDQAALYDKDKTLENEAHNKEHSHNDILSNYIYNGIRESDNKKYGGESIKKWLGFEEGGELPEHLQGIDLTKINSENSSKINSEAYRNRLRTEYFNAHNIELSDVDLDNMIGDLNNQLTLGADDGTKGFYTQNVPDPNAAGFMMGGYGQIDQDGNQVNQRTDGYDWNNPTRGNIYIARNASQKAPFNEIDDEDGYVMPGTSMEESIIQHEVNHRLNSLQGSPLSSAATSPLYDESYEYHNSFFGNAPDDNPFNAKFEDESFRAYATQPFEIKSQKAQLEQALSNAGIWDPSKGPFTQADVDKMVERNITFNKGFGYLPRGLGINELVEGTIKAPGKLTNPMNSYSEYIGDKFDNFLGKKGVENFGDDDQFSDMRNTSSRPFEQIKRNLNSVEQGSEKWNEWSDEYKIATTQYYNARGDSKGIKDALKGEYPNEKTKALLLERGIKVGPDGWYEPEMDDQINTVLNEYQEKTNAFKNTRDLIGDKRPKEEGLFGAYGPIKNFKGRKAEREAVKRFNEVYGTDFKEWKDIEFEHYEGGVSQTDKNVKKVVTETSVFDDMKTSFDREINTLQDLQKTGGHENRKAFYKNDFKINGDFRKGRRTGRNEFNMDMANAYMSSLKSNPETNKEGTDVFDNSYVPPNIFDNAGGYAYYPYEEGKKLREQNRTNFKTAVDNGVWRDDLFTQAVLNLRASDRDAFIEYYNQDPDQKFETKADVKKQKKLVQRLKSSMPDIRNFLEKKRAETSNFIKDNNRQYELDKEQQLINDNLRNKNLNEKIAPNLIKFMNEVAMEDESMPTNLAKFGGDLPKAQYSITDNPLANVIKGKGEKVIANKAIQTAGNYIGTNAFGKGVSNVLSNPYLLPLAATAEGINFMGTDLGGAIVNEQKTIDNIIDDNDGSQSQKTWGIGPKYKQGGSLPEAQDGIQLRSDATNVYIQNPNIPIAQEETVMPGSGIIYDPTRASRNPNLQWMMGAQPGVTPGTSYADNVAIGYNELIGATTPIPILEGLQLTSKGARIPGLIDDVILGPIAKGYKWMKSSLSSGSKASSSGAKTTEVLNEPDLEAMADRLDAMAEAFEQSLKNTGSKAEKDAAAELWAKNNLDEITAMRKVTDEMPKSKVSLEIKEKLNNINIGDGGSQIKKTDLEVYINPKTGEIEQFHSLKDGKVTASDIEKNLSWEFRPSNHPISGSIYSGKNSPKDEFILQTRKGWGQDMKLKNNVYGPWKNQKGGEPAIQDNTFKAVKPEVIIDQVSENNKKENQVLGLSNILDYLVESRGGDQSIWTNLADNVAFHESGAQQRMDPQARQITSSGKRDGLGRGMFQFEPDSFKTAQKRYKNVANAVGYTLDENILNAESALDLSAKDQYTLFFANLIESPAVLKDYGDGKLSMTDVWLTGHKNVSKPGNRASFAESQEAAKKELGERGFLQFTLEDLLPYKSGGEYNIFQDYVTGNYDNTDNKKQAEKIYDKLNRIHYKEAKEAGMSPANYIMTNLMGHS